MWKLVLFFPGHLNDILNLKFNYGNQKNVSLLLIPKSMYAHIIVSGYPTVKICGPKKMLWHVLQNKIYFLPTWNILLYFKCTFIYANHVSLSGQTKNWVSKRKQKDGYLFVFGNKIATILLQLQDHFDMFVVFLFFETKKIMDLWHSSVSKKVISHLDLWNSTGCEICVQLELM